MLAQPPSRAVTPRLSPAGSRGLLMDMAQGAFDADLQDRVLALAAIARQHPAIEQAVPGMNNLLLVQRAAAGERPALEAWLLEQWAAREQPAAPGREIEIAVVYGGEAGEDLRALAEHAGMSVAEVVRLHSAATYRVACLGAMPGFPYLSGLDPRLAMPRRAVPRMRLEQGAVIIGGPQAGVMPCAAPSGWHVIGQTRCRLFDPQAAQPTLLLPGDRVRFTVLELLP
ncbi:5-oxoprolinase subunit PxpB [Pseudomonas japonica]|nr:5-oxoprolinase subunit PxpB [Pseudomonas japonica]